MHRLIITVMAIAMMTLSATPVSAFWGSAEARERWGDEPNGHKSQFEIDMDNLMHSIISSGHVDSLSSGSKHATQGRSRGNWGGQSHDYDRWGGSNYGNGQ